MRSGCGIVKAHQAEFHFFPTTGSVRWAGPALPTARYVLYGQYVFTHYIALTSEVHLTQWNFKIGYRVECVQSVQVAWGGRKKNKLARTREAPDPTPSPELFCI